MDITILKWIGLIIYSGALIEVFYLMIKYNNSYRYFAFLWLTSITSMIYIYQTISGLVNEGLPSHLWLWDIFDYLMAVIFFVSLSIIKILLKER